MIGFTIIDGDTTIIIKHHILKHSIVELPIEVVLDLPRPYSITSYCAMLCYIMFTTSSRSYSIFPDQPLRGQPMREGELWFLSTEAARYHLSLSIYIHIYVCMYVYIYIYI